MSTPTMIALPQGFNRPELTTHDLTFDTFGGAIDPFLIISLFDMRGPVFPPHPHAGFSVATYIFPESEIGFWNQDTLGHRNAIAPGALHVTVAGAGVMHEETVSRSGRSATGLQIWIDLAHADRTVPPRAVHLAAPAVPVINAPGVVARVLMGTYAGVTAPVDAPVTATLVDIELSAGARLDVPVAPGNTAFAVIRSGTLLTDQGTAGPATAVFANTDVLTLIARDTTRLTLFAGTPLKQSPVPAGPFVAATGAQAQAFRARFLAGDMGRLVPFDQAELDAAFDAARA
jgi:redox-sensitive bicupin YhaK (pirin superfamily)